MRYLSYLGLIVALCAVPAAAATKAKTPPAATAPGLAIVAEVGGEAISSYDVDNRVQFIIVTARLSNTPEVLRRIRPQVIHTLIDEKLELQEATRNTIEVTDKEIAEAIVNIEQQRGMAPGAIEGLLKDNHIPYATFQNQIRAQLAWSKYLSKKVRPRIRLSEEEITLTGKKLLARDQAARQEYKVAVIALPIDNSAREAEVQKLADKLVSELRGGASFEEVSRQFHEAVASPEAFWVQADQLDKGISRVLIGAAANTITDPVRTPEGISIIKVYDVRDAGGDAQPKPAATATGIKLKEITLQIKPDAKDKEADAAVHIAEEVAKHPGNCEDKTIANLPDPDSLDIQVEFRDTTLEALPPALRVIVEPMKIGSTSTPLASDDGVHVYMLCDRKEGVAPSIDRDRAYGFLMQQKMGLEAQRVLRGLRHSSFIDIRQ